MANRMRRAHQRRQTATRARSLPLQGQYRNEALGRARRRRRQPHQHRLRDGKEVTPTVVRPSSIWPHTIPTARRRGTLLSARLTRPFKSRNFAPESSYDGVFASEGRIADDGVKSRILMCEHLRKFDCPVERTHQMLPGAQARRGGAELVPLRLADAGDPALDP